MAIRFQNTGTAPAYDVIVHTEIDPNLDINSFHFIEGSHSTMVHLNPETKQLSFYMMNIELMDSLHNEPESHGFVKFLLNPLPGLEADSTMHATADIYFDSNDPVTTNTTWHTILDCDVYAADMMTETTAEFCYAPELLATSGAVYSEEFLWTLDDVVYSDADSVLIGQPGEHELKLEISNPLCGSRIDSLQILVPYIAPVQISGGVEAICEGSTIILTSNYAEGNQWTLDGVNIGNAHEVEASDDGVYTLTVTDGDCELPATTFDLNVNPLPTAPAITQTNNTLTTDNTVGLTYTWYLNGIVIPGANSFTIDISQSGEYVVQVSNENGCTSSSSINAIYTKLEETTSIAFAIYPNPSTGNISIRIPSNYINSTLNIYDS
jgi:hypothetical protein